MNSTSTTGAVQEDDTTPKACLFRRAMPPVTAPRLRRLRVTIYALLRWNTCQIVQNVRAIVHTYRHSRAHSCIIVHLHGQKDIFVDIPLDICMDMFIDIFMDIRPAAPWQQEDNHYHRAAGLAPWWGRLLDR
jgi:hypothetical protein